MGSHESVADQAPGKSFFLLFKLNVNMEGRSCCYGESPGLTETIHCKWEWRLTSRKTTVSTEQETRSKVLWRRLARSELTII